MLGVVVNNMMLKHRVAQDYSCTKKFKDSIPRFSPTDLPTFKGHVFPR